MTNIKFFSDNSDLEEKTVLLRLDLNVPIKNKIIQDDTRIAANLPFIRNLIKKRAKIIIISHLGRPEGKKISELSLAPIYKYLKKELTSAVYFFMGDLDNEIKKKFSYQKGGEIILFENIRFFKEETEDDEIFSKKLASLCDIYINDAFSCCHRKQASIHNITKFVNQSYAGPLINKEINSIDLITKNKKKPVSCIIGGSKVSTKINVITSLIKIIDNLIIVGAMANNFLSFKKIKIGSSLVEKNIDETVGKIYEIAKNENCNLIIPEDCKVGTDFLGTGENKNFENIKDNEMILDIGPKTVEKISYVIDNSNTILWNGPAGYFENDNFLKGTLSIAKKISENTKKKSLISILGGGDTISAINKNENKLTFTHLSTAGGAFLEYLEGKDLPGLIVLK